MKKSALAWLSFAVLAGSFANQTAAQEKRTLADLEGAKKLSADELRALVTGAKVSSLANNGSLRRWENSADGKFVARSTNAGEIGANRGSTGTGSWHISAEGQYCVAIEWPKASEKWCRYIFRSGDKYFGVTSDRNPKGSAFELGFTK